VISVAEDYPGVEIVRLEFFETNALDRSGRADRHEDGRLNLPTPRRQHARPRLAVLGLYFES
jgi:hypothetical protein